MSHLRSLLNSIACILLPYCRYFRNRNVPYVPVLTSAGEVLATIFKILGHFSKILANIDEILAMIVEILANIDEILATIVEILANIDEK